MSWREEAALGDPGVVDRRLLTAFRQWISPLVRLAFRPRLEGLEHLPTQGPYLMVANHSGLGNAELLALASCFVERMLAGETFAGMVHPISYNAWPTGRWVRAFGGIPSTYAAAEAALARGIPVLVFPGGDHEAMRPVWQAPRVDFAGRKGFLKIAQRAGVPLVPVGIRGSHYTAPVILRSDRVLSTLLILPRLLGMKRFPLTLAGVLGAAAMACFGPIVNVWVTVVLIWLWMALPLSQLPWIPWSITITIGQPIAPENLFRDDTGELDIAYERARGAVQSLVSPR
ncbi:1-acyl-sn-glycerol-3-phosphate acyltransferase [Polyangium aurulentum]|uniref:1-acyl-sn-glycerol-3-phosphate acyltransferase n=1 Tax=Polyangium aurulentum TaxID=2567896 RepID=UPI0010AE79FD|nr:1-acyl-sn-glycerol-3-phosphate acyltransferase [Polyangium aurulentum]UQA57456.1 1-acyl-sn-glycerol-3-phosphate acyltransferase [Polyangium aurulentum]